MPPLKWEDLSAEQQLKQAHSTLKGVKEDSPLFDEIDAKQVPKFRREELGIGEQLGAGSFCAVKEIIAMRVGGKDSSKTAKTLEESAAEQDDEHNLFDEDMMTFDTEKYKEFMNSHVLRNNQARYAIKRLRKGLDPVEHMKGMVDLALEAEFLTVIHHPNIIKMRAVAEGDYISENFFIILDRLYETLDDRIDDWRDDWKSKSGCMGCLGVDKISLDEIWLDRMVVAYDLASAMRHIHSHKLIYRDIKPDNIGFDVRGNVKIFDFGLCKELRPCDLVKSKSGQELYNLTGITGSRRYMAPEVVLCKPYNLSADVYSFGILLYEMFSFEIPFNHFTGKDHKEKVVDAGYRPVIPPNWPIMLKTMVKQSWSSKMKERPPFTRIAPLLRGEMESKAAGVKKGTEGFINRSMHMMDTSKRSYRNERR